MNNTPTDAVVPLSLDSKDSKRYLWLIGLLVPTFPYFCHWWYIQTGSELSWWYAAIVVFIIGPPIDMFFGKDKQAPSETLLKHLEHDPYYKWLVFLYIPLQYIALVYACYVVTTVDMSWFGWLGFVICAGIVNGNAINAAHELGHRQEKLEKQFSLLALAPTMYGHFLVEHNRGHHHCVATFEDPSSSRLGESLYQFLPRSMVGSLLSALELESARLKRGGLSFWSFQNIVLKGWGLSFVLYAGLCLIFGLKVLPFLIVQGLYGATLLEVVNYLEHYGLLRQKNAKGRYRKCEPEHSWNSDQVLGNLCMYHLQRHSDHHANPGRRYQSLRPFEESPQLPWGYSTMMVIAYFPPLWRWVMDKRVVAHYGGDVNLANIHPPSRRRLLRAWAQD